MVFDADGSCALSALAVALVLSTLSNGAAAAAENFPFNDELLLDTKPMRGSKRVPTLRYPAGWRGFDRFWCNSVQGQFVVAANTITVLTGPKTSRSCSPERERGDQEMLSALEQVTNWRREGDAIVLIGPQKLRFYRATN